jgi:uncharacterized membrane protein YbaN (DUF454 family)
LASRAPDYRAGLGIARRTKAIALGSMAVVMPLSVAFGTTSWVIRLAMIAIGLIGVGFVITRATRETVLESV